MNDNRQFGLYDFLELTGLVEIFAERAAAPYSHFTNGRCGIKMIPNVDNLKLWIAAVSAVHYEKELIVEAFYWGPTIKDTDFWGDANCLFKEIWDGVN